MGQIILLFIGIVVLLLLFIYHVYPAYFFNGSISLFAKIGGFTEKQIEVDGINHSYFDNQKKNKPVAVFLHGFTDKKESWFPFLSFFFYKYRIILPDLIGHGKNIKDESVSYTFETQAHFIKKFTEKLNIYKFNLLGISMGGAVSGKYAQLYQNTLLSLTMISNAGINGNKTPSVMEDYLNQFDTYEKKKREIPILPLDMSNKSMRLFKDYLFSNAIMVPDKMFRYFMRNPVEHRLFYIKILEDFLDTETGKFKEPIDEHLKEIKCPVLIIWGDQDKILHVSSVKVLEENLPNPPDVVIIKNCGHGTYIEYPIQTHKAILQFLNKHNN